MLNICCVMVDNYCGRGPEYVEVLHDMVRRNLAAGFPGRFVCFTDDPDSLRHLVGVETRKLPSGLKGWWNKLYLFSSDAFPKGERVLYFDLDTVITGPLDDIAAYAGEFAILRDAYRPEGLQSSVMAWEAGKPHYYGHWLMRGCPELPGGDQQFIEQSWLEKPQLWQDLFPGLFRSYKKESMDGIPNDASVVFFHGHPRPHEADGWVPQVWKVGGGSSAELINVGTVPQAEVLANIRSALEADYPILEPGDPIEATAVICGGGPSLRDQLFMIAALQRGGAAVFSCNQVDGYLRAHGITPAFHVMLDARPELSSWVNQGGIKLYASICAPTTLEAGDVMGELTIWHPVTDGAAEIVGKGLMIGGGTTVGTRAMALAYAMGFRKFLCVGFDSSYRESEHHAYPQSLNDGEKILDALCNGQRFKCAPWMVQQANDWRALAQELLSLGCEISVFGDGLIPAIAASMSKPLPADERAQSILSRLEGIKNPVGAEIGVFAGDLSSRLLNRADLTLYMVDSWAVEHTESYKESGDFHAKLSQAEQDDYHRKSCMVTAFAGPRAKVIRKTSIEAARAIPDGSLDFVFIDADHSYEGCRADIAAWLPKVRAGGLICGHDYENTEFPQFGVRRAVDEMFSSVELGDNFTWFKRIEHVRAA